MRRRFIIATSLIVVLIVVFLIVVLLNSDPGTSSVTIAPTVEATEDAAPERVACLTQSTDDPSCIVFPGVAGNNLNGKTLAFPDSFEGTLNFVVMPFDREQQVNALEWLTPVEALAVDYPELRYFSIAALPDLDTGIRILVVGGMAAAIQDEAVRDIAVVLFLEDQPLFADALQVDDLETIQVFLLNDKGEVLWRAAGDYNVDDGAALSETVQQILAENN